MSRSLLIHSLIQEIFIEGLLHARNFLDGGDKDTGDTNPCPHGPCIAGKESQTTKYSKIYRMSADGEGEKLIRDEGKEDWELSTVLYRMVSEGE